MKTIRAYFVLSILLCAAFAFFSCAPTIPFHPTRAPEKFSASDSIHPRIHAPEAWKSHGAYFAIDEVQVQAATIGGQYEPTKTGWFLHKEIVITSPEGKKYATLPLPKVNPARKYEFKLIMRDSTGQPVLLDTAAIRKTYLEKGIVVFPNAHPGCRVGIILEFWSNEALYWMDHWLSAEIPIQLGKFTFIYSQKDFAYRYKEYGGLRVGEEVSLPHHFLKQTWSVENQAPRSSLGYQEGLDISEPRLSLVMERAGQQPMFSDWKVITSQYERLLLHKNFFRSESKLRKITDSLTQGKTDTEGKAAAILAYCQNNITLIDGGIHDVNPDHILRAHQGTLWEITVVAKSMLEQAKIATRIWLSRTRSRGGFDPKFITPGSIMVPLLSVRIGPEWRLFYPYLRGGALGDYPVDEFNAQAMDLASGEIDSLPLPRSQIFEGKQRYTFDLGNPDGIVVNEMTLNQRAAYRERNTIWDLDEKDLREHYQKGLSLQARQNLLHTAKVTGLRRPGEELLIRLEYYSKNQVTERKGKSQIRFGHLFDTHLDNVDSSRTTPFFYPSEVQLSEVVKLLKPKGRRAKLDWTCRDINNRTVKVQCQNQEDAEAFTLTRTITIAKSRLNVSEILKCIPDITEMNRIRESSVTLE